jgi:hypothetical protein
MPRMEEKKIRAIRVIRGALPVTGQVLSLEPISERMHGQQMPRLGGNVLDLLAQFHDQLVQRPRGAVIIDAPDFIEQRFARNGVAAFAKENGQDF